MPQRSADRKKKVATAGGRGKAAGGAGRRGRKRLVRNADQKREGRPERIKSSRLKGQLAKTSQESGKVHTGRKYVMSQSQIGVTN